MACMCGDTHCWSCGPAQGNTRCPICGLWADDECDHLDLDTGKIKPEFEAKAKEIYATEAQYERDMDEAWLARQNVDDEFIYKADFIVSDASLGKQRAPRKGKITKQ